MAVFVMFRMPPSLGNSLNGLYGLWDLVVDRLWLLILCNALRGQAWGCIARHPLPLPQTHTHTSLVHNVNFVFVLQVRDLVEKCTCPSQFPMVRVSEGKYRIGDTKVLIFVRVSMAQSRILSLYI